MKFILNISSVNPKYALLGLQFVHVIHLLSFWQLSLTGLSTLILNLQSYCYFVIYGDFFVMPFNHFCDFFHTAVTSSDPTNNIRT